MEQCVRPGAGAVDGPPASVPTVELRLPAEGNLLFLVRLVAEGIAAEGGLGFDEIADLRVAVEEAVATLAVRADDGAVLDCAFRRTDRVTVCVATSSAAVLPPGPGEVGWHLLRALADSVASWTEPARGEGGWRLCLEFTKDIREGGP